MHEKLIQYLNSDYIAVNQFAGLQSEMYCILSFYENSALNLRGG